MPSRPRLPGAPSGQLARNPDEAATMTLASTRFLKLGTSAATIAASRCSGCWSSPSASAALMPVDPVRAIVGEEADQATYEQVYRAARPRPAALRAVLATISATLCSGDFGDALPHRAAGDRGHRPRVPGDDRARDGRDPDRRRARRAARRARRGATQDRPIDHVVRVVTLLGHSMPIFWIGMMGLHGVLRLARLGRRRRARRRLLRRPGRAAHRLPADRLASLAGEWDVFWNALNHLILPASILGYSSLAYITRMTRSFMLEQLSRNTSSPRG